MSTTLSRFGVPLLGGGGRGMMRQPKPKYRFRVMFYNFGFPGDNAAPVTLETNTCGRPSVEQEEQEVHGYNSKAYYAGKHSWQPIEVAVRDTIDNEVQRLIAHQQQMQFDHYSQVGFRAAVDYKFAMKIQMMDGSDDGYLDTWDLEGCWVTSFNYGDLDYTSSEAVTISMNIRYDNAFLTDENGTLLTAPINVSSNSVIL